MQGVVAGGGHYVLAPFPGAWSDKNAPGQIGLRWTEREDQNRQSEPGKHLKYFSDYKFE